MPQLHVLLADDDGKRITSEIKYLKMEGIDVDLRHDWREVMPVLREKRGRVDCVVLDIKMRTRGEPAEDAKQGKTRGLDLLLQIKAEMPELPVLIYTIFRTREIREKAMALKADDYLVKGESGLKSLLDAIRRVTGAVNGSRQPSIGGKK